MVQEFKWIIEEIQKKSHTKISISKKSKTIKKASTEIHKKVESVKYSDIWGVSPIFNTIVSYVDNKNLAQFNAASKKMHQLTNPVIHRSLRLMRDYVIRKKELNRFTPAAGREAEISECIKNNSKYAHLVKEISLSTRMKPVKTIEFFNIFKFLTKLDINATGLTQGQFIRMIKPLTQLQELNMDNVWITERNKNLIKKVDMCLPTTLIKLTIDRLYHYDNPALFIQFINSHDKLEEFKFTAGYFTNIFSPFQKNYSSMRKFEYSNSKLENYENLLNFIKLNPQLHSLHLELDCLNEKITDYINQYSVNLEELSLCKVRNYNEVNPILILKFKCPTIIKKLKLNCEDLSESSLNSILTNFPQLRELEVFLPYEWRSWGKLISTKCVNLEKLTINPSIAIYGEDKATFIQEFYKSEFLTNRSIITGTLTQLTFYGFDFVDSKAEYFNMFKNLKIIKFSQLIDDDDINNAWPNYNMKKVRNNYRIDIELTKIQ
ncbi:hypothetical protein CONCODRAFT_12509 [Conidiobolus coronatus NRRL 28638]|uniref:F-box domain-containing protein n=1 Tax=Conidiobolus coronatus (strain ATCC 28846 / CBS 209.66 / NRRL 28638) TaxID=796925 RepID=A0A137NSZ3_CONC2|nr:hypothetical protein CONCODRAFT_12509 [Conidiobolus coronatus NRRL 28638]|eukprot:KXN65804.1 hypothetical protein CONCODRAFT_12509 [Conidiobolus coronatus NRRL 28638]